MKIEEGQSYFTEGSYDVALSAFRDAIKIIPQNTEVYREIGAMYFKTGRLWYLHKLFGTSIFRRDKHL